MDRAARALLAAMLLAACPGSPLESGTGTIGTISTTRDDHEETTDASPPASSTTIDSNSGEGSGEGTTAAAEAGLPTTDTDPSGASEAGGSSGLTSSAGESSGGLESSGGGDSGPGCAETDEPNQDFDESFEMGTLDCDGAVGERSGVIDGSTSPDWWYYYGDWSISSCGNGNGKAEVTFTVGAELGFCLLGTCPNNVETVTCTQGSNDFEDACCGMGTVAMDVDCFGTDNEGAYVDVIIDAPAAQCMPYTFQYSY